MLSGSRRYPCSKFLIIPERFVSQQEAIQVGVIGDTHGLLREQALTELQESDLIIHTGDVGRPEILEQLAAIAPTYAIRGNVDHDPALKLLPAVRSVDVEQVCFYVIHDLQTLDIDPAAEGYQAVLYGHSHQPKIHYEQNVLYLNPGSAGRRRFHLPVAIARLRVRGGEVEEVEIRELEIG